MIIFNLCLLPGLNKCLFDIGLFHLCSLISLTNSHTSKPFSLVLFPCLYYIYWSRSLYSLQNPLYFINSASQPTLIFYNSFVYGVILFSLFIHFLCNCSHPFNSSRIITNPSFLCLWHFYFNTSYYNSAYSIDYLIILILMVTYGNWSSSLIVLSLHHF